MNNSLPAEEYIYAFYSKQKRPDGGYYVRKCKSIREIIEANRKNEVFIACKKATQSDLRLLNKCIFTTHSEAIKFFTQIVLAKI